MSAIKEKDSGVRKRKKGASGDGDAEKIAASTSDEALNTGDNSEEVVSTLQNLYREKLLPIEQKNLFNKFNGAEILDAELSAKPTILLIGQYSTGKTSFIRHLIGMDYPEIHIGPEPTTDRFIAVMHGDEPKVIKGNALTGFKDLPFSGLSVFGTSFLNKFSAALVPAPLLRDFNIVDTPGVLSGEKQRLSRGYDFAKVARWFAERSDLILLLFDCSKLDISDEFKLVIEELQPHEDKVHCILNKADQLDQESLMRVYGALLWSMGRILKGAEVARIYVGSFHDQPLLRPEHEHLFTKDKDALMDHVKTIPKACSMRKVNEMVKRIRLNVVHACILGALREKLPWFYGKDRAQLTLISKLDELFLEVRRTYQLSEGDFPKVEEYKQVLSLCDFSTFPRINRRTLDALQTLLREDIPRITVMVSSEPSLSGIKNKNKNSQLPDMFNYSVASEHGKDIAMLKYLLLAMLTVMLSAVGVFVFMNYAKPEQKEELRKMLDGIFGHHEQQPEA